MTTISPTDPKHLIYLRQALSLARLSTPLPTNFRVGAVLVSPDLATVLSTGYTLELSGNTHAEQCCLAKLAANHSLEASSTLDQPQPPSQPQSHPQSHPQSQTQPAPGPHAAEPPAAAAVAAAAPSPPIGSLIPRGAVLYTTMEPCIERLSGAEPCVQRILATEHDGGAPRIGTVVCGVREPATFVGENRGRRVLEEGGVTVLYVPGLEEEILQVATAGHVRGG